MMTIISICFFIYCLVLRIDLLQAQENLYCNCDNIQCENITCPDGYVEVQLHDDSNGLCDCCSGCVLYKKMDEGDCREKATPKRISACSRFYTSDQCDVGLMCDYNEDMGEDACMEDREPLCFITRQSYADAINSDWYLPIDCAKDGTYMPKQCKQNKCFCVDEDGNRIFGEFPKEEAENTNCACSLMEIKLEKASEKTGQFDHVVCQKNGNFHKLQCLRDTCFCVNEKTGELTSIIVPKLVMDQLPCYDKISYQSFFNSPCLKQREYEERLASFYIKHQGVKHEYLSIAKCNPDATYVAKQCTSETCYCADPATGLAIGSYYVTQRSPLEKTMNCQCSLDMIKTLADGGSLQSFDCAPNGNYKSFSCQGFQCYCVDADGYQNSQVLNLERWADNFCKIDSIHKRIRNCYLESYKCDEEKESKVVIPN